MLEIFETLKSQSEWGETGLFEAMDDLMEWARVDGDWDDGPWPDGRVVCAECVLTLGDDVVGMGRVIWDSHVEESCPRIAHLCVTPAYRTDFVIDSLQATLIEAYALQPIGGDLVKRLDGATVDLADPAGAMISGQVSPMQLRMI
jgi:hypothetical protein